uniref:Cytochrome c oxidase subunit 5A, mitochondrial n=1 Tax=Balaenoptera musculus TaxID=9771 RepID=A0A8C0DIT3_BALMU
MGVKSSSYYVRFETAQGLTLCAAIAVTLGLLHPPLASCPAAALQSIRCHSHGPHETDEEFDARWVIHFNKPDIAAWELRKGMNTLVGFTDTVT